jgi:hypothetical protein
MRGRRRIHGEGTVRARLWGSRRQPRSDVSRGLPVRVLRGRHALAEDRAERKSPRERAPRRSDNVGVVSTTLYEGLRVPGLSSTVACDGRRPASPRVTPERAERLPCRANAASRWPCDVETTDAAAIPNPLAERQRHLRQGRLMRFVQRGILDREDARARNRRRRGSLTQAAASATKQH